MSTHTIGERHWRVWGLLAVGLAVCVALFLDGPITQDQDYHRFADARGMFGLPNFWNVVSNAPFLVFGLWGVFALLRDAKQRAPRRRTYLTFFIGSALVAFGSAYYHADPGDATLAWDRLPMTIAFMAFFAAIIDRHVRSGFAARGLLPLLLIGVASVIWWRVSGDLRVYLLVQFLPILTIPLILLAFPVRSAGTRWIWAVLGVYVLAKILEVYDAQLYSALGMSGHALKHLAAAFGVYAMLRAVRAEVSATGSPLR